MQYINNLVDNNMNETNIKSFTIRGLFGTSNITLNFDREVNIYIGENGSGKTTILNCFYYLISQNYRELLNINFYSISLVFKENKEYTLTKADINAYVLKNSKNYRHYYGYPDEMIEDYIQRYTFETEKLNDISLEMIAKRVSNRFEMPRSMALEYVINYFKNKNSVSNFKRGGNPSKVDTMNDAIRKNIVEKIEYFTTYRRIENDFSDIISRERAHSNKEVLIKFGMSDVQEQIDKNLSAIKTISIENFNRMTGVLLKEYSSIGNNQNQMYGTDNKQIDHNVLKVILDRLGNEIENSQKIQILDLFNSGKIFKKEYIYLLNLINKLINSYNDQKIYDDRIKNFVSSCNKYMNGKEFVYNPSELKLDIILENDNSNNNNFVTLSSLSSGEKQIVSLFSKIYLDSEKKSILIIDEPELSLSMKWQKMLIPDIIRSKNCALLLTVTHSPFIFDNEFDRYAKEMRNCISVFEEE